MRKIGNTEKGSLIVEMTQDEWECAQQETIAIRITSNEYKVKKYNIEGLLCLYYYVFNSYPQSDFATNKIDLFCRKMSYSFLHLTDRQIEAIEVSFGLIDGSPLTRAKAAYQMGIHKTRIDQLIKTAKTRLNKDVELKGIEQRLVKFCEYNGWSKCPRMGHKTFTNTADKIIYLCTRHHKIKTDNDTN
ncbi:MAG: hypothetical protein V3W20_08160 [Candidatus Neomarinimicrobiota bacterium]